MKSIKMEGISSKTYMKLWKEPYIPPTVRICFYDKGNHRGTLEVIFNTEDIHVKEAMQHKIQKVLLQED